jgi:hypothetical protein
MPDAGMPMPVALPSMQKKLRWLWRKAYFTVLESPPPPIIALRGTFFKQKALLTQVSLPNFWVPILFRGVFQIVSYRGCPMRQKFTELGLRDAAGF